jgi:serine/threonine protein kinase
MVARTLHPLDPPALGAWSLTTRIATGSGTVVYRGVDRGGRIAAVKAPLPYGEDRTVLSRLCREARVLTGLGTPGIARLLDDGTAGDVPHLAVELVDGPSLRSVVDRGGLDGRQAFVVAARTARTLARLHGAGVVHADLKPGNVLCSRGGPVVVDFDAAVRRLPAGPGGSATADLDGRDHAWAGEEATVEATVFRASPAWLAPEQALGEEASAASDVFSWAAVATFALLGRSPFGAGPAPVLLYRIVHAAPDLADLPRPLAGLLGAALEKSPTDRPTSLEVVGALRRLTELARRRRAESVLAAA